MNLLEVNQSEAKLRQTVSHALSNIISDGFYVQGKPHAQRFGIPKRGRLAPGCFGDVTVLDPSNVGSPATYENPKLGPVGIRRVFRNGRRDFGEGEVWTQ